MAAATALAEDTKNTSHHQELEFFFAFYKTHTLGAYLSQKQFESHCDERRACLRANGPASKAYGQEEKFYKVASWLPPG